MAQCLVKLKIKVVNELSLDIQQNAPINYANKIIFILVDDGFQSLYLSHVSLTLDQSD